MFLKVVLGIIIKLEGGRFGVIDRDGGRSQRFFSACLRDAEEILLQAVLLNVDCTYWPKGAVT